MGGHTEWKKDCVGAGVLCKRNSWRGAMAWERRCVGMLGKAWEMHDVK